MPYFFFLFYQRLTFIVHSALIKITQLRKCTVMSRLDIKRSELIVFILELIDFNGVFHELSRLRGPVDIRKTIVMDVINECLRFKRRILADLVKDFMNNLAGSAEIL